MRLMVTGGAGFIGSNFIRLLRRERPDWRILNVDALTYAGNLENLAGLERDPNYDFVRADVADPAGLRAALDDEVDAIVHFAAESHVDRSIEDASAFLRTNVIGTQVLLDLARERGLGRFVHVSTDEVYGSLGAEGLFREDTPLAPNSPYSASKASSDLLVRAAVETHGLDAVITRCSNNYGPYQFPEKLIPLMIANALEDRKLPVYGSGLNVRDWIWVEDHCRGVLLALEKGKKGEVYNFGGRSEMTNIAVVEAILAQLGKPSSLITHVEDRKGHDLRYAIDCGKAERELGFGRSIGFEEGLARTIAWYRDHEDWWRRIRSGAYRDYYARHYGEDLA
ncbi:MAG: dTDP-glucose 4,6-dehydratase [Planctomycetes bacterium]|nr:dTDP-glucose 4,6-dehydratase [Planctomycetota bacterium]